MTVDASPFALGDIGGSGPAVLCLHGLTGTPYEIRGPAKRWPSAASRASAPSCPVTGRLHGYSARPRAPPGSTR